MEEESRRSHRRSYEVGIMEEESWGRNDGGRSMEEEAWRRNHGGGVMEEESWRRNHRGGIMEDASWTRHHGGGHPGITRRHLGGTRRPLGKRNSNHSQLKCKCSIVFSISRGVFEGRCHFVSIFTRINAPRQPWRIPRTLQCPLYNTVRTPLAKASLGKYISKY